MKSIVAAIALAIGLAGSASAADINKRAALARDGSVEVSNVAGNIEIRGWDRDEIEVTGQLWDGAEELVFESDGHHARVEVRHERGRRNIRGSRLVVRVPASVEIHVSGVSADIDVDGITGPLALQTVSGDIDAGFRSMQFEARTVSGDIDVRGHDQTARIILVTVSGEITALGLAGDVEFSTVSGDTRLGGKNLSRLRGNSVSGDMDLDIGLAADGRGDLEAINGDISIRLANVDNIGIDLESFNGDIDEVFGHSAVRKSKYGPGNELRVTVGSGKARLSVETLNGDIGIVTSGDARSPVSPRHRVSVAAPDQSMGSNRFLSRFLITLPAGNTWPFIVT